MAHSGYCRYPTTRTSVAGQAPQRGALESPEGIGMDGTRLNRTRRHSHRARRRAVVIALGVAMAVTFGTSAFASAAKPKPGPPQVSGHDVKAAHGFQAGSHGGTTAAVTRSDPSS